MVDLIAHRGASSEAPENTLSAIQAAANLSVDYIEIDIRLSKEGIPIVIHDSTLLRTTNCLKSLSVSKIFLEEISSHDAGFWFSPIFKGEKVPTLKDVLNLDLGKSGLMLEIKKGPYLPQKMADAVLDVLKNHAPQSLKYKIGSFDLSILEAFKQRGFHSLIGIIDSKKMLKYFIESSFKHLAIWHKLISPPLIQFLHVHSTLVWSFTLDEPSAVAPLLKGNLDGIITNKPRLIKSLTDTFNKKQDYLS